MRKLLLVAGLAMFSVAASAQSTSSSSSDEYHKFKVDLTAGYAIPPSNSNSAGADIKAGVTFGLEPHYRLIDAIAVGLRIEGAGLAYGNTSGSGENTSGSANVSVIYSYCPSFEYYFLNGGFRPFVGAGAGIFSQGSVSVSGSDQGTNNTGYVSVGSKFGFFPRAGFEVGHFRISAEYNVLGKDANGNSSSYAAFNLGFFFGGGRK